MRRFIFCFATVFFFITVCYRATAVTTAQTFNPDAPTIPDIPTVGPTERVSLSSSGSQGNENSDYPDLSTDGRYVAFASAATNLVNGDTNGWTDIFAHDQETNTTSRVSVRSNGEQANGNSFGPAISGDGRVVVFYSLASNLVDGDTNGRPDIFAHDRQTGQTTLVSVVVNGTTNGDSFDPDVSRDGRYVVFSSFASNLIGGDNNNSGDIFRWDRIALTMARISIDNFGTEANSYSRSPSISGDGQRIVFTSNASNLVTGDGNNLADIFMRDTSSGTTSRINIADGTGASANGDSWDPAISEDGQFIVYASLASNLVSTDFNGYPDIFLRDLPLSQTRLVSRATDGTQANDWCESPAVSNNGRFVTFKSFATTLVSGSPPNTQHIFLRDRQQTLTVLASVSSSGNGGNGPSGDPAISANARVLAFSSVADNLVPDDSNGRRDIFVHGNDYAQATLTINNSTGAPGSYFVFSGANWAVNGTAVVTLNSVTLGNVPTDGSGNIAFQLITNAGTEQGLYIVTVTQGSDVRQITFMLRADYPLRPGSGAGINVPNNSALSDLIYLPVIRKP
jgi:Tol biopolymer transport system component